MLSLSISRQNIHLVSNGGAFQSQLTTFQQPGELHLKL